MLRMLLGFNNGALLLVVACPFPVLPLMLCGVLGYFLAIELCLTGIAVAAAYAVPGLADLPGMERLLQPLVRRPRLAVIIVGLLALAARAAVLPVLPVPEPTIHDEFSYLLAADTFAHGRLTNPTHPMWMHFETFHVNQKPTYASMYYPAQGLLLAFGRIVFGHPFFGVWLSVGLMCAAICWMLQGWLPRKWALLGGMLAVMRLGIFSYWANSYYGGTMAAIGGALVLGALPRIQRRRRRGQGVLMALGLAIIANTRPYEGLFLAPPVAGVLFAWMFRNKHSCRSLVRQVVLPMAVVLALTIGGMAYYFWRVTGSPFRIPYQVNMATYGLLYFPWQELKPLPEFHHNVMRDFYREYSVGRYNEARSEPMQKAGFTIVSLWLFFLGPVLSLPFSMWIAVKSPTRFGRFVSWKTRFFCLVCLVSVVGLLLPIYVPQPHYVAPLTCVIYALVLQAMRHARFWRYNQAPGGRVIVLAIPFICIVLLAVRVAIPAFGKAVVQESPRAEFLWTWGSPRSINVNRARVLAQLNEQPGRHLVIVRYRPDHDLIFNEWVYNEADIDNAKVVWAREMSLAENQTLIRYFHDRKVWLAEPDERPPKLSPYAISESQNVSVP